VRYTKVVSWLWLIQEALLYTLKFLCIGILRNYSQVATVGWNDIYFVVSRECTVILEMMEIMLMILEL
jgi:hypothetical protein